jgi:hypothetical protein
LRLGFETVRGGGADEGLHDIEEVAVAAGDRRGDWGAASTTGEHRTVLEEVELEEIEGEPAQQRRGDVRRCCAIGDPFWVPWYFVLV